MGAASRFHPATRALILERANFCCEMCGTRDGDWSGWSVHHRRPAGMGGDRRPETRGAANGVLLCGSGCHGWVESHRDEARERGLLPRMNQIPADEPVQLGRGVVRLDDAGNYLAPEGAAS